MVAAALAGLERYVLPDPVREDYLAAYQGNRLAESMRYVRAYPAELPVLAGLLPQIRTPVQIIAGAHDTAVPPVNAEFLASAAAPQQARRHRRGPFHLGRCCCRIRRSHHQLVGGRLQNGNQNTRGVLNSQNGRKKRMS